MGKHTLRKDMTCLNCRHVVEKRFCPNCGQENKHTRESFHYLFTHFIEDLTHYDGSFWKTIKHLLFNPAKLTKEYLAGKRQTYVPPVKLYIFISFVTFFLLSVLPVFHNEDSAIVKINNTDKQQTVKDKKLSDVVDIENIKSVAALDSIQNSLPEAKKTKGFEYWLKRKLISINEHNTLEEFMAKFTKSIYQNLPKVIFMYLPLFAFILWLFHNKKRWYYYEHGVYTFHYFSMLLLSFSIFMLISWVLSWFEKNGLTDFIFGLSAITMYFWWIFYFFRSHSRLYQQSKFVSRLKVSAMILINSIFITIFLFLLLAYSALNVN